MVNLLGKLFLNERKTDCTGSCCLYCSFIVGGKLHKFYNGYLFLEICLNIHNAKTGWADAIQSMSAPQLCSCFTVTAKGDWNLHYQDTATSDITKTVLFVPQILLTPETSTLMTIIKGLGGFTEK